MENDRKNVGGILKWSNKINYKQGKQVNINNREVGRHTAEEDEKLGFPNFEITKHQKKWILLKSTAFQKNEQNIFNWSIKYLIVPFKIHLKYSKK